MALIEGIGDEVLYFFIIIFLLMLVTLAWTSTRIREPTLRTVLILERQQPRQVSGHAPPTPIVPPPDEAEKPDDGETNENSTEPAVEVTETENKTEEEPDAPPPPTVESSNSPSIRIRLKYLNDELKLVEGNLEEQLGDFKKRHFSLELSGRKLVRLIFNGHVLGQDSSTLGHYGLFDNCVVHCLVHQPRTPPPSPNLNTRARGDQPRAAPLSAWALSHILLASLSLLLGIAWYGRYQYAQLYTATTTVALVGLTGIFTVSLIGIYMPDPA